MLMQVAQAVEVSLFSCNGTCIFIPGAAILVCILQAVKVTLFSCNGTCIFVPGTAVLVQVA